MSLTLLQHGYFGTRNYGDERSAWVVRQLVRQIHPDARFFLVGADAGNIERYHADVDDFATRDDWPKVKELATKADAIIYGPGTVLGNEVVYRTLDLIQLGRPFFIWGAGVWTEIKPDSDGAKVLRAAAGVAVRDRFSFDAVSRILDVEGRVCAVLVGDPMFYDAVPDQGATLHGVNVSWHLVARETPEHQERVLQVVADAMAMIGGAWIGIPASWNPELFLKEQDTSPFDNDVALLLRLQEKAGQRIPFLVGAPENFEDLSRWLGSVDLVITSRLHLGIPVLGGGRRVVYFGQPKLQHMAESLGVPEIYAGDYYGMSAESLVKAASAPTLSQDQVPDLGVDVLRDFLARLR
ncbi:MAG: polysaccharide pyruvyl transferase family protein [bacterium]